MNKKALLLDSVDRGTIQTVLQTNGYYRHTKLPNSSPANWKKICDFIEDDGKNELITIGKLTEHTLFRMALPEYEDVVERLIQILKNKKHLLFIYKDNLFGNFTHFVNINEEFENKNFPEITIELMRQNKAPNSVKIWLYRHSVESTEEEFLEKVKNLITRLNNDLKVLPYEKLIDIEIAGQNFIENIAEGLIFRIYIPNERIWSNEFTKFINLFRDYSSTFANEELKILQNKTDLGVVCSIYSNSNIPSDKISELYKDFTTFMELCAKNPDEAENLIKNFSSIEEVKKRGILTKYIKESQRLLLDIKQDKEVKLLNIQHRIQNEINEIEIDDNIKNYIENSISDNVSLENLTNPSNVIQTQNIYINSQIIEKIDGIVVNELNGNINFSNEDIHLQKLIEKYVSEITEKTELKNSLFELKDSNSTKEAKRASWQKLYGFIGKVADKVGDVGVSLLTKYLEQQIGI